MADRRPIILLVEDDDDVRDTVASVLDLIGFSVVSVSNGIDALRILRSDQPLDVVLTDVAMPPPNGIELAIQTQILRSGIKCVLTSGYPQDSLDMPDGCLFLSKPFSLDRLNAAINQSLCARRPVPQNA